MAKALRLGPLNESEKREASSHLEGFRASTVAKKYLQLLEDAGERE